MIDILDILLELTKNCLLLILLVTRLRFFLCNFLMALFPSLNDRDPESIEGGQ